MKRISLTQYLVEEQRQNNSIPAELRLLIEVVARACKTISHAVGKGALGEVLGTASTENVQGEVQKKLDIISNEILLEAKEWGGHLAAMASEEMETIHKIPNRYPKGEYLLTFDPLGIRHSDPTGASFAVRWEEVGSVRLDRVRSEVLDKTMLRLDLVPRYPAAFEAARPGLHMVRGPYLAGGRPAADDIGGAFAQRHAGIDPAFVVKVTLVACVFEWKFNGAIFDGDTIEYAIFDLAQRDVLVNFFGAFYHVAGIVIAGIAARSNADPFEGFAGASIGTDHDACRMAVLIGWGKQ